MTSDLGPPEGFRPVDAALRTEPFGPFIMEGSVIVFAGR